MAIIVSTNSQAHRIVELEDSDGLTRVFNAIRVTGINEMPDGKTKILFGVSEIVTAETLVEVKAACLWNL